MEFPHDELIGQGIEHKVGVQTKAIDSTLALSFNVILPSEKQDSPTWTISILYKSQVTQ